MPEILAGNPEEYYEGFLNDFLREQGISLLEYPKTDHQEITKRAIGRKRPFVDRDRGYRDTLIWLSVINLLKTAKTKVALITSDKGFFQENLPHADLIEDLSKLKISAEEFLIFPSLKEFNMSHIVPLLEEATDLEVVFSDPDKSFINLFDFVQNELVKFVRNQELEPMDLELSYYLETMILEFVEEVKDIDLDSISVRRQNQKIDFY